MAVLAHGKRSTAVRADHVKGPSHLLLVGDVTMDLEPSSAWSISHRLRVRGVGALEDPKLTTEDPKLTTMAVGVATVSCFKCLLQVKDSNVSKQSWHVVMIYDHGQTAITAGTLAM